MDTKLKEESPKLKSFRGFEYTQEDYNLFSELVKIGFTNHSTDTKVYYQSMDCIHVMLGDRTEAYPYNSSKNVSEESKNVKFTYDGIIKVARYFKERDRKAIPIANFFYNPWLGDSSLFIENYELLITRQEEKEKKT